MFARFEHKLDSIITHLINLTREFTYMTPALQELRDRVAESTSVMASAVFAFQGLASQLHAASDDPAAVKALASQLHDASDALAAAIVASTPIAPPDVPVPPAPAEPPAAPAT